ncbi:MAG: hypothetical protein L6243_05350 [Candidatus Altiarchaeales archaeon]|nr:hypothetical protein [Candidatus Altiarchaeales archaeon]
MSLQEIKGSEKKKVKKKRTSIEGPGEKPEGKKQTGSGEKQTKQESKTNYDAIIKVLAVLILVVFGAYAYMVLTGPKDPSQGSYAYSGEVLGIEVKSEFPLESLQNFKAIALLNSSDAAITSCNYELSAISQMSRKGYIVRVEKDSPGIYIKGEGAWVRGRNSGEILSACHAFACLREGIECPDGLLDIPQILAGQEELNLVIDGALGEKSFQKGIITIGYALGTLQSQTGAPVNTWLRNGDTCFLATVLNSTGLFKSNITENSSCDSIDGIHMLDSEQGEIRMEGNRITLQGSDGQVYAGTVIVQNIIAPDLRERLMDVNIDF